LLALAAVALFLAALGTARVTSAKLVIVGFGTNETGAFAVIQLTNAGPRSIAYWGYKPNQPRYIYRFDTPAGPSNYFAFPDPNGSQLYVLRPRQSVDFKAQTMKPGAYRIELAYTPRSSLDRLDRLRDWLQDNSPELRWVVSWIRIPGSGHLSVYTAPLNGRPENGS
jgi:hypothetical protein